MHITHITASWILDSRGVPTVACTLTLNDGYRSTSSVPSGASTGSHEALELRDHDSPRFNGRGVFGAVRHITNDIALQILGEDPVNQEYLDHLMVKLDGTPSKSRFGANALLAVSIAIAKAGAHACRLPLYQHIANLAQNDLPFSIPIPMSNVINGGAHAGHNLNFQEFMLVPNRHRLPDYTDQLEAISNIYHQLQSILAAMNQPVAVGDEGGFAPTLRTNQGALVLLQQTILAAGYDFPGFIAIGLDLAANDFYQSGQYNLKDYSSPLTSHQYVDFLEELTNQYQLVSLEDPIYEDDLPGWQQITRSLASKCLIVGDDYLVTNPARLKTAIDNQSVSGVILKPNQVGTVTETITTALLAKAHNIATIVAHRSGDTPDTFVSDLAVGIGADFVKFGAPARGERVAKYNRLLEIAAEIST